jgi:hypothetical protein
MAKKANVENSNTPSQNDVQGAVRAIEECYERLAKERGIYMRKCKGIREDMAGGYDDAANRGIAKKLLKKIVKERELERKIAAITDNLEDDERSELDMLIQQLGNFANTPLGAAAIASARNDGKGTAAQTAQAEA